MELCEEVESVRDFCYLGDRVNASGGCEAAVTARARIGWVKESKSVGLKKEDAKNLARWRVGVGEIAGRVG